MSHLNRLRLVALGAGCVGLLGLALRVPAGSETTGITSAAFTQVDFRRVIAVQAAAHTGDVQGLYEEKCSLCHGSDRRGKPPVFPTLVGVSQKYTDAQITDQIRHGKGKMPAYPGLSDAEITALVALLKTPPPPDSAAPADGAADKPQQMLRASMTAL